MILGKFDNLSCEELKEYIEVLKIDIAHDNFFIEKINKSDMTNMKQPLIEYVNERLEYNKERLIRLKQQFLDSKCEE